MKVSQDLQARSERAFGGGPATLSKDAGRFTSNAPRFLIAGDGCRVTDVDGNVFYDTIAGLGPVLLGHCDPEVDEAVMAQVGRGVSFSLPHMVELQVAEMICRHVLCAERVRFAKNGADVTQAAVRVARAATGKNHVLCCGYHGMHDWYISTTERAGGVLKFAKNYNHQFQWGNSGELEELVDTYGDDVAAIIVEVPPMPWGTPDEYFETSLIWLKSVTRALDAVFIMDEVVTGFRYGLSGAHGRFGVIPDMVCLGKGMANGYPLAALAGEEELMRFFKDGEVFLSTTNGGEAVSLAAAKATVEKLSDPSTLAGLRAVGTVLGGTLQKIFFDHDLPVVLTGDYARMVINWGDAGERATKEELRTLWLQETLKDGVLFGGPTFTMTCMTLIDVEEIGAAAEKVCERIAWAIKTSQVKELIEGPLIGEVFKKRYPDSRVVK